jgi:hypothetical protein
MLRHVGSVGYLVSESKVKDCFMTTHFIHFGEYRINSTMAIVSVIGYNETKIGSRSKNMTAVLSPYATDVRKTDITIR